MEDRAATKVRSLNETYDLSVPFLMAVVRRSLKSPPEVLAVIERMVEDVMVANGIRGRLAGPIVEEQVTQALGWRRATKLGPTPSNAAALWDVCDRIVGPMAGTRGTTSPEADRIAAILVAPWNRPKRRR